MSPSAPWFWFDPSDLSLTKRLRSVRVSLLARLWFALCALCLSSAVQAAERIPPVPTRYFNDYANVVPQDSAEALNRRLEQFERDTSNQILVAIYPKMDSDSAIEDYTVRVAQAWKVGQKLKNNGAVLFVFIQDRKMFLQVAYGLEGALPDATAKRIIENEIKPRFKGGDYAGGLAAGVNAIMAATKGEYKGNGSTAADRRNGTPIGGVAIIVIFIVLAMILLSARRRNYGYSGWTMGGGGFSGGGWGGGWGGGGSSGGGGGGGFSSGGGSFGGGGAGGSW